MSRRIIATILFLATLNFQTVLVADPSILTLLNQKGISKESSSFYAAYVDDGTILSAFQETKPLIPASSLKILTAYCALKELGVDHRIPTLFYSEGPIRNGTIQNLWVEGMGDPSLVSERLWAYLQQLKSLGLKKIQEDIYIDDSFFEVEDYPGRQENNRRAYNAPLSATSLNFNSVAINLYQDGGTIHATLFPNIPYLQLDNRLNAGGKKPLFIDTQKMENQEVITIGGHVTPSLLPKVIYRSIEKPFKVFGITLATLLQEMGIEFTGEIQKGKIGSKYLLLKGESIPLSSMIKDMDKFSNNFIAEQLTQYMGAKRFGPPATSKKGEAILKECLHESGITPHNVIVENGSGLSYNNKVSAKDLVTILLSAAKDFKVSSDFISSLSIHGLDGTMKTRTPSSKLGGLMKAKTGSLNGVSSLAGFIPSSNGRLIAFAILFNNFRGGLEDSHRVQDALVLKWIDK